MPDGHPRSQQRVNGWWLAGALMGADVSVDADIVLGHD